MTLSANFRNLSSVHALRCGCWVRLLSQYLSCDLVSLSLEQNCFVNETESLEILKMDDFILLRNIAG